MGYQNDEKETSCTFDYITKEWNVYTCVPRHLTKLCRIGEPYWKEEEPDKDGNMRIIAGKWKLKTAQVSFGKVRAKKESSEPGEPDEETFDLEDEDKLEEVV